MPIFMTMTKNDFYVSGIKRLFDWIFSFILMVSFLPLFAIIAIVLWIHFKSSPLYIQKRPGKGGKAFNLLKFKTMRIDGEEDSTTPLTKFLRSTSIDELPQLINVMKGEMSFVGPRPLLLEYMPYYNEMEARRHEVIPGVTGWAQVNGRNDIDWPERMQLDVDYVDKVSFFLDLKILAMTILQLLKRDKTTYQNKRTIKFTEYASKR